MSSTMSNQNEAVITNVFSVGGRTFATKAEAMAFIRRPKILNALKLITKGKEDLANFLIDNQEGIEIAFETGTIKRVTKSEAGRLAKALAAVVEANDPHAKFIIDNAAAIQESFRWPSVKRMNPEEKLAAAQLSLMALTENNEGLTNWIITNKEAIIEAYTAGVEKRQISDKATEALAAYREKKAQEKLDKEASKAKADEDGDSDDVDLEEEPSDDILDQVMIEEEEEEEEEPIKPAKKSKPVAPAKKKKPIVEDDDFDI
jgi:hypothetical protein